jgi:hypothetical protein
MMLRLRWPASVVLLASLLLFAGCPSPNATGPSMVTVAQIGTPPPDTTTNSIDLNAADVNKMQIPSGKSIRLISAITSSTPITNVTVTSNLTWQCSLGRTSEIIGTVENAPLAFMPAIPTAPGTTTLNVDSVVDPIAMTGCSTAQPGMGPVNIRGNVKISATNSAGTSTSKSLLFDYVDVGALR